MYIHTYDLCCNVYVTIQLGLLYIYYGMSLFIKYNIVWLFNAPSTISSTFSSYIITKQSLDEYDISIRTFWTIFNIIHEYIKH